MNQPEDKDPKPETSQEPAAGGVWLPPRLRQKLEAPSSGDDFDFLKQNRSPVGTIITVAVIVAVIGGAWWMYQNNKHKEALAAAAKAAAVRDEFVADSLAKVRMADSLAAIARADSIAFAALPQWKQRQILAEKAKKAAAASGATAAKAPPAAGAADGKPAAGGAAAGAGAASAKADSGAAAVPQEAGPFGIDTGQYLDEAKANEVAASLKQSTGLAASVVSMGEGEDTSYHVLLGSYPHRGTAEAKANSLLGKGLLSQALVVAIPKAAKTQ